MPRPKHPKKEIEQALTYVEMHGWRVVHGASHGWGRMYCPWNDRACRCGDYCAYSIWSTPRNAYSHARVLRRVVDNCVRRQQELNS
ncbi:MAG: hypothetical protein WBJ75_00030 [Pseudohongiellaceae bacterium]